MNQLDNIRILIEEGKSKDAEQALSVYLSSESVSSRDEAYYLQGNLCRKKGDWQGALNNYRKASDINPQSPATHAYRSVLDILNYYNKDMYNQ